PLLEAFVHKLMARRLDDRFASAHEALTTLELIDRDRDAAARCLGVLGGAPEPPPAVLRIPRDSDALATLPMGETTERVRRRPRTRWWPLAAAVAAVVAMVAVAAVVTRGAVVAGGAARPGPIATSAALPIATSAALPIATSAALPIATNAALPI